MPGFARGPSAPERSGRLPLSLLLDSVMLRSAANEASEAGTGLPRTAHALHQHTLSTVAQRGQVRMCHRTPAGYDV